MLKRFVFFAALIAAPLVHGADMTVYGFTLGEPIQLKECERGYDPRYVRDTCLRSLSETGGAVIFATSDKPLYAKQGAFQYRLIDGKLALVTVVTTGAASQRMVYQTLIEKYGKPTRSKVDEKSNAMGAKYESIAATWETPAVSVRFDGLLGSIDTGVLMIGTPAGMLDYMQAVAKDAAKGKKL